MTSADREAVRQQLITHEGLKLAAYPDHLGFLTIGVGRLIDSRKGGGISPIEAGLLLDNDINRCLEDLASFPWFATLNPVRQRAVIDMRFQLGSRGLRGFTQMLAALQAGDCALAAVCARQSKWATQTPERAATVTAQIETGLEA